MSEEIKWLTASIAGLLGLVGAYIARDRAIFRAIKDSSDTARESDDKLHDRVNRIRDEFVRRDDLDAHVGRLEKSLDQMRAENQNSNEATQKEIRKLGEAIASIRK